MLDFVDETLDQMTFTVQPFVVCAQDFGSLMRRNHRFDAVFHEIVNEMSCCVASVSDQTLKIEAFEQVLGLSDVVTLSGGQHKSQRTSQAIDGHMDLGAETATTAPQRLFTVFFRPLPRRDVPGQSYYRSSRFPYQDHH